jgi:hypothetical protein
MAGLGCRRLHPLGVLALYGVLAGACGGGDDDGESLPFATATRGDAAPTATVDPAGASASPTLAGDAPAAGETTVDHIVLHEANWVEAEDALGRPAVRFAAIVENTGPNPVEVEVSITPYDSAGNELGGLIQDFDANLGAGLRLPLAIGTGPLAASPAEVQPVVSIRQIPDFRRERYRQVVLEGEVVDVAHEVRTTDVLLTFTVSATNVGAAGADFAIIPRVAIRNASGVLIDGGITGPGIVGLCPGDSTTVETIYRVFIDDFDAESASYELFFPDVEVFQAMDC